MIILSSQLIFLFKKIHKVNTTDIKNKILEGGKLAIKKLVDRKRKENSYLIVSDHGKVVRIQAADIKL
jgi:uncharacterized protein YaiL (DUF2058 family)